MTLDEVKAILDKKVDANKIAEKERKEAEKKAYMEQVKRLKDIQPRVQNILDAYNYAKEIGLTDLLKNKTIEQYWDFIASGFYHRVGIMRKSNFMGIYAGGACGPWDFYVNGNSFYEEHEEEHTFRRPKTQTIKKFCDNFEKYETAFYDLIKNLIQSEL